MMICGSRVSGAMLLTYVLVLVGIPTLVIIGIASALQSNSAPQAVVVAKALQGYLIGEVTPQAAIFRGVPFSQPPTGEFRWKKPREPVNFPDGKWNASYYRPGCPQSCTYKSKKYSCPHKTNEDCLYLNIWVPAASLLIEKKNEVVDGEHYIIPQPENNSQKALAVMVYIHGGNFMSGAGSALLYEGRFLANQGNVIIVTTNYRLGALGFLVQGDGDDAAKGNFGVWDQISCLQWVQKNIRFFGGDPDKVTLFGQSSGAESVGVLMTSPYSENLFQSAGFMSNPLSLPLRDLQGAKEFGAQLAVRLKCMPGEMDCLRRASVEDIVEAGHVESVNIFQKGKKLLGIQPWGPVTDEDLLQHAPLNAFKSGKVHPKPLIAGVTTDEGMFFIPIILKTPLSTIFYKFAVSSLFGSKTQSVLDNYPTNCTAQCDNRDKLSNIVTDYVFTCPTRKILLSQVGQNPNTWFYVFGQKLPFTNLWESDMCNNKACHGADLPYLFDNVQLTDLRFSVEDQNLAKRIGEYWTNFAKYGNPNGKGEFENISREERSGGKNCIEFWPKFQEPGYGGHSALKLQASGDSIWSEPYRNTCDFWDGMDSYGDYRRKR